MLERAKQHYEDHKQWYWLGGTLMLAGFTTAIVRRHTSLHSNDALPPLHSNGQGQAISIFSGRDSIGHTIMED